MVDTARTLRFPAPGRLVAAGDVADAGRRHALRGRGRGGAVRRDRRRGQLRLPRPGDDPVHGRAAARAARPASSPSRPCAAIRSGRRWRPAPGQRAAGTRACSRRASRAARPWPSRRRSATATRPPARSASGSRSPVAYRIEYADGLKATMLLMNGLVERLHLRRPAQGRGRAALDAVLPAAQSQRRLLGRADVEGRGDCS